MLEINDLLFDYTPRWLFLTDDQSENAPAILLTPLDWTQYELCRRFSAILGTDVTNPRGMFAQIIKIANPTQWRGFVRNGVEIPFDKDLLFSVLCANVNLGAKFDQTMKAWAMNEKTQRDDAAKNSDAGRATPDAAPGKAKKGTASA